MERKISMVSNKKKDVLRPYLSAMTPKSTALFYVGSLFGNVLFGGIADR
jgi:hypothetical protein